MPRKPPENEKMQQNQHKNANAFFGLRSTFHLYTVELIHRNFHLTVRLELQRYQIRKRLCRCHAYCPVVTAPGNLSWSKRDIVKEFFPEGATGGFFKSFSREARTGEINFFPHETKKTTLFFTENFKIQGKGQGLPFPTPMDIVWILCAGKS